MDRPRRVAQANLLIEPDIARQISSGYPSHRQIPSREAFYRDDKAPPCFVEECSVSSAANFRLASPGRPLFLQYFRLARPPKRPSRSQHGSKQRWRKYESPCRTKALPMRGTRFCVMHIGNAGIHTSVKAFLKLQAASEESDWNPFQSISCGMSPTSGCASRPSISSARMELSIQFRRC